MSSLSVCGKVPLNGEIAVQGAKNSVLPILSAAMLTENISTLFGCPRIADVFGCIHILNLLGCSAFIDRHTVIVDSATVSAYEIPDYAMQKMRSSILFLAPLLARTGKAVLCPPGGCPLGARPIDLHLLALSEMGMTLQEENGHFFCQLQKPRFIGAEIYLPVPSVGATEQILIAAVTAEGCTRIHNAAREPEVEDLIGYLNACGGRVFGGGTSEIIVYGVDKLHAAVYSIMPDRIVATTYMAAAAVTGGKLTLTHVSPQHLSSVIPMFIQAGCKLTVGADSLLIRAPGHLSSFQPVTTGFYPEFSTDAQPLMMALATKTSGRVAFRESVFENRFCHAKELCRLGADIKISGKTATVYGADSLHGATVTATDLRGGAAMVVCGLCADGVTTVFHSELIERGYEAFAETLAGVGACIADTQE